MRPLATISKIQNLQPIEGKDRIELATVENYPVIVQKGQHKIGDLVVYIFYDSLLPIEPQFEFLRKRCYSPKYNAFRICNMKMSGVYSSGIIFDLSILPLDTPIKEGLDITDILHIVKYDPELEEENAETLQASENKKSFLKFLYKFKITRWIPQLIKEKRKEYHSFPNTVPKSDETNIEAYWNIFKNIRKTTKDNIWLATEKLEGCSASYMLYKKRFKVFSRNNYVNSHMGGHYNYIAKKFQIEKYLRNIYKKTGRQFCLQGEIIGPGIQKNIYKLKDFDFYVFNIFDTKTGCKLSELSMKYLLEDETYMEKKICNPTKIKMVPRLGLYYVNLNQPLTLWSDDLNNYVLSNNNVIEEFSDKSKLEDSTKPYKLHIIYDSVEDFIKNANGKSVVNKDIMREGIVWRSIGSNCSFKAKSREYALWFDK